VVLRRSRGLAAGCHRPGATRAGTTVILVGWIAIFDYLAGRSGARDDRAGKETLDWEEAAGVRADE
jgi:hypothetical protein